MSAGIKVEDIKDSSSVPTSCRVTMKRRNGSSKGGVLDGRKARRAAW
jgi:hypothetical protein